ncbi:MAG: YihY/virulence factor BrkB family protein [Planctomycetes bacterium]|nr:YihY/virulence factor BrkB family protein [Planctomycetota bacterium]
MSIFSASWGLIRQTVSAYLSDDVPRLSAALSYYTVFSIAPLLIIATGIAGLVFGHEAATGQVHEQIAGLVGNQGAEAIQDLIRGASRDRHGWLATIIGLVVLLIGASGVFGELQQSLNAIWGVRAKPGRNWLTLLRVRFLSFSMVFAIGFLLMVSLLLSAGLSAATNWLVGQWEAFAMAAQAVNLVVSLVVMTALFALIYRFLPDVRLQWRDVLLGSAMTAGLFTLGKFLIGLYIGHGSFGSSYGAVGSLVVLLVWVYYSAQIFLIGAEFTKAVANKRGSPAPPKPHAEREPCATAAAGKPERTATSTASGRPATA